MSAKEPKERGAVEVITPDEDVQLRLETIATVARACETLAAALNQPMSVVTINGNVSATGNYGVRIGKRKPRSA